MTSSDPDDQEFINAVKRVVKCPPPAGPKFMRVTRFRRYCRLRRPSSGRLRRGPARTAARRVSVADPPTRPALNRDDRNHKRSDRSAAASVQRALCKKLLYISPREGPDGPKCGPAAPTASYFLILRRSKGFVISDKVRELDRDPPADKTSDHPPPFPPPGETPFPRVSLLHMCKFRVRRALYERVT
ncbi:hypothetical protein EVAR_3902_1 [Eumeta japonica]|uniref:Uncharacterized protein n=1 Tax=Eumeta variegata TaxID=151549 RepID=A0A4C1STF8_EUMVA|nr:hypothetical protein EVAR_3902_1 [Eumeta japonica]